jgi:hypothetical protein
MIRILKTAARDINRTRAVFHIQTSAAECLVHIRIYDKIIADAKSGEKIIQLKKK